jgi:hypothetical protein
MAIIREFPPPAKAGIYDLEASYYHSIEAMNKSSLVYFDRSPAHYQAYLKEGGMVPTRDMLIGTAFDLLVFSPERFKTQVVVDLTTNKNKKEYKVWREAQADDAVIISQASYDNVRRMRDEMMKKEQIAELMTEGYGQRSVFWQDPRTNIWCKARPDWITPQAITVDLKKARWTSALSRSRTNRLMRARSTGVIWTKSKPLRTTWRCCSTSLRCASSITGGQAIPTSYRTWEYRYGN